MNNIVTDIISKNYGKHWKDWIEIIEVFNGSNKQGIVGLLKIKEINKICVFKISQNINNLINHEYNIMKGLNTISKYCPHFSVSIGILSLDLEPKLKIRNPFKLVSKYPIQKDVLLMEHIDHSDNFYTYIKSCNIDDNIIYSIIKQVLLSICIAQNKKKFSHYDLHSSNIMIKKCNKDLVLLYVINNEIQFLVPTYGYYPIIIDFGFGYIEEMENNPLWTSLAHTEVGFTSDRFDWVSDPKLFLVSVCYELKHKRNNKSSKKRTKKFEKLIRSIYKPLKLDWDSGWDLDEKHAVIDTLIDMLEKPSACSNIFSNYNYYCFDLLQSLIVLPLQEQNYNNIKETFKIFINEFIKIENEISDISYIIYILKNIIDFARDVRPEYYIKETRLKAVTEFKNRIYEMLGKISKYCIPKKLHFEKMLCSLLISTRCMEGILYEKMVERMEKKQKKYKKLQVSNVQDIYGLVECTIPDTYTYTNNTIIFTINCIDEISYHFTLPTDIIEEINENHSLGRGTIAYDFQTNIPFNN